MKHKRYLIGAAFALAGCMFLTSLAYAGSGEDLRQDIAQGRSESLRSKGGPIMCRTFHVLGMACVLGLAAFFGAEVRAEGLQGLEAEEREVREETFGKILKGRRECVQELIALAAKETQGVQGVMVEERGYAPVHYPWHDAKHLAMILLGDLRAAEAVPILLENLEYRVPRFTGYTSGRFAAVRGSAMHPATEALVKIGMPAVEPLVEKLAGLSEDGVARRLGVLVLDEILGRRLARARLQMVIEEGDKALAESPAQRGALTGDTAKLEARIRNVKAALDLMAPEPPDAWKYPEEVKPTPPLPPWPEHIRKEDLQGK